MLPLSLNMMTLHINIDSIVTKYIEEKITSVLKQKYLQFENVNLNINFKKKIYNVGSYFDDTEKQKRTMHSYLNLNKFPTKGCRRHNPHLHHGGDGGPWWSWVRGGAGGPNGGGAGGRDWDGIPGWIT